MTSHTLSEPLGQSGYALFTVAAALLVPLLPMAAGLIPGPLTGLCRARLAHRFALASFITALVVAGLVMAYGPACSSLSTAPWQPLSVQVDALTAAMLLLVSFLGAVVTRYSCRYLAGDARQGQFSQWLCLTVASVLTLVIAGNLLLFTLAWAATSLSLHRLLTFYPNRPAAVLAARKKFLISRLGDVCLIGGLVLAWQCFGTWEFRSMFAAGESLHSSGANSSCVAPLAFLLVLAAALKSAQFPFHSWLPDTMETPTPVSALMHAGIINAGGFLVVRLSPILVNAPAALNTLAIVGAFTALFASVVMLTQTSVKRSLAYSTIAQMGFMMLQCGLGAFALATLHLVAHSLYKAHAFLSSGSVVALKKAAWTPAERPAAHPGILVLTLATAVALTFGIGSLFGTSLETNPGELLLGAVFLMALAYLFWSLWATSREPALLVQGILAGTGAAVTYFALHGGFQRLLSQAIPDYAPERSALEYAVMILVVALFLGVLTLQAQLPAWAASRRMRALYVHTANGGYLGIWANQVTASLFKNTKTI